MAERVASTYSCGRCSKQRGGSPRPPTLPRGLIPLGRADQSTGLGLSKATAAPCTTVHRSAVRLI